MVQRVKMASCPSQTKVRLSHPSSQCECPGVSKGRIRQARTPCVDIRSDKRSMSQERCKAWMEDSNFFPHGLGDTKGTGSPASRRQNPTTARGKQKRQEPHHPPPIHPPAHSLLSGDPANLAELAAYFCSKNTLCRASNHHELPVTLTKSAFRCQFITLLSRVALVEAQPCAALE